MPCKRFLHIQAPPPQAIRRSGPASTLRRWFLILLLTALAAPGWATPFVQAEPGDRQSQAGEYELKAVYLLNFLHFVHLPEGKGNSDGQGPKVIGIIGDVPPLHDALLQLKARLQDADKEKMAVIELGSYQPGMDLSRCDLVFVSGSEQKNFATIAAALKNSPVLTVSETDGFLAAGGMIALVTLDNKLRWEINRGPVQAAGLRLNAKLLDMAVRVVNAP